MLLLGWFGDLELTCGSSFSSVSVCLSSGDHQRLTRHYTVSDRLRILLCIDHMVAGGQDLLMEMKVKVAPRDAQAAFPHSQPPHRDNNAMVPKVEALTPRGERRLLRNVRG